MNNDSPACIPLCIVATTLCSGQTFVNHSLPNFSLTAKWMFHLWLLWWLGQQWRNDETVGHREYSCSSVPDIIDKRFSKTKDVLVLVNLSECEAIIIWEETCRQQDLCLAVKSSLDSNDPFSIQSLQHKSVLNRKQQIIRQRRRTLPKEREMVLQQLKVYLCNGWRHKHSFEGICLLFHK